MAAAEVARNQDQAAIDPAAVRRAAWPAIERKYKRWIKWLKRLNYFAWVISLGLTISRWSDNENFKLPMGPTLLLAFNSWLIGRLALAMALDKYQAWHPEGRSLVSYGRVFPLIMMLFVGNILMPICTTFFVFDTCNQTLKKLTPSFNSTTALIMEEIYCNNAVEYAESSQDDDIKKLVDAWKQGKEKPNSFGFMKVFFVIVSMFSGIIFPELLTPEVQRKNIELIIHFSFSYSLLFLVIIPKFALGACCNYHDDTIVSVELDNVLHALMAVYIGVLLAVALLSYRSKIDIVNQLSAAASFIGIAGIFVGGLDTGLNNKNVFYIAGAIIFLANRIRGKFADYVNHKIKELDDQHSPEPGDIALCLNFVKQKIQELCCPGRIAIERRLAEGPVIRRGNVRARYIGI